MKEWYIIHSQAGSEEKVKRTLEYRTKEAGVEDLMSEIIIPTELVSEIRGGKKRVTQRKLFPGYLLLKIELNNTLYSLIRKSAGVTGFIGTGKKPTPVSQEEVDNILKRMASTQVKPSPKITFEQGEQVRITEGPFVNFNGAVDEANPERGKIKVTVSIFGRATPIELEYWQVEKI
ncbi:MAG: transcription termination/antitermination factor NusG [Candidatus Omnitrophica bacterium]|nr:transcription termination/antitermination factor NusG [Candidatus Omnitrophota bacterium]